jgi:hypothetical protein
LIETSLEPILPAHMNGDTTYIPSRTLPGESELIRERAFTRWMPRDLRQAATDFCKNIGLSSIYSEVSPEGATRYLFWHPPDGAFREVRSGRTLDQFKAFDHANIERGMALLSLHISPDATYSAVWISPDHYESGKSVLATYGITPAERKPADA